LDVKERAIGTLKKKRIRIKTEQVIGELES
jgi:hypothetical protein